MAVDTSAKDRLQSPSARWAARVDRQYASSISPNFHLFVTISH